MQSCLDSDFPLRTGKLAGFPKRERWGSRDDVMEETVVHYRLWVTTGRGSYQQTDRAYFESTDGTPSEPI